MQLICFATFLFLLFTNCHSFQEIKGKSVEELASYLENEIGTQFDKHLRLRSLKKVYSESGHKVKMTRVDGSHLVYKMSKELTERMEKKMNALKRLVKTAEDTIVKFNKNPELWEKTNWVDMVNYMDNKTLFTAPELNYNRKFKQEVSFESSAVHLPVEIYNGNNKIQNGLKWTSDLDKVFKENLEQDPRLLWQYFGSHLGFMRMYPINTGIINEITVDLFDVRYRPWFIRAQSSPKDVLILMDISGSMHGLTMGILRMSVKMLLYTLAENDYVNVAYFKNNVKWISCLNTFIPATRRNRKILLDSIDELTENRTANLSEGLKFAFMQLINFRKTKKEWEGSDCNQIIIILSDGGTEEAWTVLQEFNKDSKIRVFTYAIGAHPVPYTVLKDIACNYKGYFTVIPSMSTVRTRILEYLSVLSRPVALNKSREFHWTNFYMDLNGLNMLTTLTYPVYNNTDDPQNTTLAGVMALDISIGEMTETEPKFQIGFGGYSYALTRNGYVVFHPNLNIKVMRAGYYLSLQRRPDLVKEDVMNTSTQINYLDQPPYVDILDLEQNETEQDNIRSMMIDRETGEKEIMSIFKLPRDDYAIEQTVRYFYTPVNKTSYSLALVIPASRTYYYTVNGMDTNLGLEFGDDIDGVHLAPWRYCHDMVLDGDMKTIIRNISITLQSNPDDCDRELTQRLLLDKKKTDDLVHLWKSNQEEREKYSVVSTFITTESGLTRMYPVYEKSRIIQEIQDPSQSTLLIKASQTYFNRFVAVLPPFYEPSDLNTTDTVITFAKSIDVSVSSITSVLHPGIIGIQFEIGWLQNHLKMNGKKNYPICNDSTRLLCYLLDDGAFIVSSNSEDWISEFGRFFGEEEPVLMEELTNKSIYRTIEEINYDDVCEVPIEANSGIRTAYSPLHGFIQSFNLDWLFDLAAWKQLKLWIYGFITSLFWPKSSSFPLLENPTNYNMCTTSHTRYYMNTDHRSEEDTLNCANCTRQYATVRLQQTNLILLVTTSKCPCDIVPKPAQAFQIINDTCEQQKSLYRRKPTACFDHHHLENVKDCTSTSSILLPHFSLLIEVVGLLLLKLTSPFFTFTFNG